MVCVPINGTAPPGYREVVFGGTPKFSVLCKCDSSTPYAKELLGAITIGGAYKLLKFTHDTTPKMVAAELKRFELRPTMVKRLAPRIAKSITSKPARFGSLAGLFISFGFVAEEMITDHVVEKALDNKYVPQMKPLYPESKVIYKLKDIGKPGCLGTNMELEVQTHEALTVPNQPSLPELDLEAQTHIVPMVLNPPLMEVKDAETHKLDEPSKGQDTALPAP